MTRTATATVRSEWLRHNLVPLIVALALLMEMTDATVLSTALPPIAKSIHAPVLSLKLALATYLISLAALVPASGWIVDRFGAKRVFVAAMLVFLAGSALCAVQTSLAGLILSRALQGAGGAMMVPVGRLIVLRSVSKEDMVQALAYVTVPALIGPALGPVLGALLTTTLGWPWIFLINLPIGGIATLLALHYLPNISEPVRTRFDPQEFILSATGLAALMFGMSAMGGHAVSSSTASVIGVSGMALLTVYFISFRKRDDALLDTRLLRWRTFRVGAIGGTLFRSSVGAAAFLLPLLFQIGFGLSVMMSGAMSALYALGGLTMRALAPRIIDRFGFRPVLILGTVASCTCTAGFGFIQSPTYPVLVPLLILAGFSQALVFTTVNGIVFADMAEAQMSRATSFSAVTQQFALTLGIAVSAYILQLGGNPSPAAAPVVAHFGSAFWTVAALSMMSVVSFFKLQASDGAALRHREHGVRHHWP
jgi:EmrB/QacA subfamily drug resistance transporter